MKLLFAFLWLGLLLFGLSYLLRWFRKSTNTLQKVVDKRSLLRTLQKQFSWYRATQDGFSGILEGVPFSVTLRSAGSGEPEYALWFYVHTGMNYAFILSKKENTHAESCPPDWIEVQNHDVSLPAEYSLIAHSLRDAQEYFSPAGIARTLARLMQLGFVGLVHVKGGVFVSKAVDGERDLLSEPELRAIVSTLAELPHQMPRPAMNYGL